MKKKLDCLYEDKELLVINKEAKLLCIGTKKEQTKTLYQEASAYVKKQYPKNKVFIVNRLDKETSGIVVFAKNETLKKKLQENWNETTTREYLAIVEGKMEKQKGRLESFLKEDKMLRVYCTNENNGRLAITNYETLKSTKAYSLLKINIETGRKNQIRVQLNEIGHPIIGDKKYGSRKNPIGRMGLHASFLKLKIGKKEKTFYAKIPNEMKKMFEKECIEYEKSLEQKK